MTPIQRRKVRELGVGLAFLTPNILGFLCFIFLPLLFNLFLAFSNWDLKRHNMFKDEAVQFVGLDHFLRLFTEPNFWRFLGNTLFLMMAMPFAVMGSLLFAILLSKDTRGGGGRVFLWVCASLVMVASVVMLTAIGMAETGMVVLLAGIAGGVLVMGMLGGNNVYRTFFFMPHFTAGVATFLLWKKIYAPHDGPLNTALQPVLDTLGSATAALPADLVRWGGMYVCALAMLALFTLGLRRLAAWWRDGEVGTSAAAVCLGFMLLPMGVGAVGGPATGPVGLMVSGAALLLAMHLGPAMRRGRDFTCAASHASGSSAVLGLALLVGELVCLGLGHVLFHLPTMASDGLQAPLWIHDYDWAKPSLMIMSLWAAIGSNNMLLYLAALTNVPESLYEAADIDGASRFQKFWNVTWPQLAPTTFFIVVMSTISGLQGGFEMARTMTQGGPGGATTTLSYFIYVEGFATGRLGYASAISWVLFLMVLVLTLINWKFGNRYVND